MPASLPLLVDVLEAMHKQSPGVNVVGTAFLAPLPSLQAYHPGVKFRDLLSTLTVQNGCGWRWDPRGYVVIGSTHPYDDRLGSISAPVLRELYQRSALHPALALPDYLWLMRQVTDEQIESTLLSDRSYAGQNFSLQLHGQTHLNPSLLMSARSVLRLLGSLTAEQLDRLRSGGETGGQEWKRGQLSLLQDVLNCKDYSPGGAGPIEYWPPQAAADVWLGTQAVAARAPNLDEVTFSFGFKGMPTPLRRTTFASAW